MFAETSTRVLLALGMSARRGRVSTALWLAEIIDPERHVSHAAVYQTIRRLSQEGWPIEAVNGGWCLNLRRRGDYLFRRRFA